VTTRYRIALAMVLLAAVTACGGRGSTDEAKGDEKQPEHEADHDRKGRADEVRLSAKAVELAGIRVGRIERRALGGGVAIPAEVQFEPTSTAHVGPLVSGRFTKIAVALGDRVRKGQLLGVVASSDVSGARARLDQARAKLSAAEATLRRQQQLSSEGIGAQRALVDAQSQTVELQAEVEGLRRQLSVFGSGSSGELKLVSPMDGVVVEVLATLGETGNAEQPAFVVTDPSKVWMRGSVPELEIERVEVGMAVLARLHAFPDAALPGTITYVAPALDERTRSLPIRATLDRPDPRLRSGLYGDLELIGGKRDERVLVVPTEAVATLEGQQVVFVPTSDARAFRADDEPFTFRPVPVRLGRQAGAFYELQDGLQEGAALALSGAFTLKSAMKRDLLSEGHSD
jgi:cobalt-zinc-cadmium efflux system membrane fusion protein